MLANCQSISWLLVLVRRSMYLLWVAGATDLLNIDAADDYVCATVRKGLSFLCWNCMNKQPQEQRPRIWHVPLEPYLQARMCRSCTKDMHWSPSGTLLLVKSCTVGTDKKLIIHQQVQGFVHQKSTLARARQSNRFPDGAMINLIPCFRSCRWTTCQQDSRQIAHIRSSIFRWRTCLILVKRLPPSITLPFEIVAWAKVELVLNSILGCRCHREPLQKKMCLLRTYDILWLFTWTWDVAKPLPMRGDDHVIKKGDYNDHSKMDRNWCFRLGEWSVT